MGENLSKLYPTGCIGKGRERHDISPFSRRTGLRDEMRAPLGRGSPSAISKPQPELKILGRITEPISGRAVINEIIR